MNSLVVPIVLWGNKPPTHRIKCVAITNDEANIITGCMDGQLCIWEFANGQAIPKLMLFGHSSAVVDICAFQTIEDKRQLIVSVSDCGEIFLWDLNDGRCIEQTKLDGSPIAVKYHSIMNGQSMENCLICYGQFAEIFILNAFSLQVVISLVARIYPDWLSSASVLYYDNCTAIVGLTMAGTIKVWQIPKGAEFPTLPILEDESKQLRCLNAVDFSYSDFAVNLLLVVCRYEWQLYDAGDFSLLCTVPSCGGNTYQGGCFITMTEVALWDSEGIVYIYHIPFTSTNKELYRTHQHSNKSSVPNLLDSFMVKQNEQLSTPPVIKFVHSQTSTFIVYGNGNSDLVVWNLPAKKTYHKNLTQDITVAASSSLKQMWDMLDVKPPGIIDSLIHGDSSVSASLFLDIWGLIACGKEDGSIVLAAAAKACRIHLLHEEQGKKSFLPHKTLRGHHSRVTCLLYPHQESSRYSSQLLVSGSADFSVILWDLVNGTPIHTFHNHGGEITELMIPPKDCSSRILNSICSVAADNSVALLSIRERKCVMLASCHSSPVTTIKWRPFEDFMLVACCDGSLYVWQMETGHLDRHITGITVSEILSATDSERSEMIIQNEMNLSQAFKMRNFSAFKAAAEQGIKTVIENIEEKSKTSTNVELSNAAVVSKCRSMWVQALRASPRHDSDSHVVFFNVETLIGNLLQDHALMKKKKRQYKEKAQESNTAKKVFTAFISQVRTQLLDVSDQNLSSSPDLPRRSQPQGKGRKATKLMQAIELDSAMDVAQILLSCLHGWGLDTRLDGLCKEKLGIFTPFTSVCFGLLSREGHICLMLPSVSCGQKTKWTRTVESHFGFPCHVFTPTSCEKLPLNINLQMHTRHWEISSSLTTQHLIGVIAVANTMMELSNAGFLERTVTQTDATSDVSDNFGCTPGELAQAKQGWSLLATLHCILLPDLIDMEKYKPPKLELLARRWQDRCLEVREAAQALLLAKLRQIGEDGRRLIVQKWIKFMPDYVEANINTNTDKSNAVVDSMSDRVKSPYRPQDISSKDITTSSSSADLLVTSSQTAQNTMKLTFETRRRQAIAIIILGVMGSEFGQEAISAASTPNSPEQEPFSFARQTCRSLVYLLLQPASSRLPAHAPIRRAAIDLLGRGFTVWEPYVEASAVLLGLLELCIDYDTHVASIHSGLPLSAEADSCRSAHHALCLIASARPLTFITTIAREVARHNAAHANPQHQALLATSVLVRSKREVLQIIELLADKMMADITDLIVEVVDIILFCLESVALKSNQTFYDSFPVLSKFHTISFDAKSKRIAIGTKSGCIVMHDLRSNKHSVIARGRAAVTALSFSPEGKYLGVYSMHDNQLCLWMTSSSLFGIIQSQVKCVKTIHPLPPAIKQKLSDKSPFEMSQKQGIRLVWVSNRVIVLLLADGSEYRCHV